MAQQSNTQNSVPLSSKAQLSGELSSPAGQDSTATGNAVMPKVLMNLQEHNLSQRHHSMDKNYLQSRWQLARL